MRLHVFDWTMQHLARWNLIALQQKLSEVQRYCQTTLCCFAGALCVVTGLVPIQINKRAKFFHAGPLLF